jgi:hypothetical protein
MTDLVLEGFIEKFDNIWTMAACNPDLGTIDADRPILASMVDLQNSGDCQSFSRIHLSLRQRASIRKRWVSLTLDPT